MRNKQPIVAMSIYLWTIVSLGINNTKSRVSVNLNYKNFFRCLYTFLHFHLLIKNELLEKNANPLGQFSQIWQKVSLNELDSSLCKIMKSHALLQRISLIIRLDWLERIWSFLHPSGCQMIVPKQTVSTLTNLSLVIGPVADCYKQCKNHFGVNVSTPSSLLLFKC